MEAVRLAIPPDALRLVRGFSSDRVGVHPTAAAWDMEVDRFQWQSDVSTGVEWRFELKSGRVRTMWWLEDGDGVRPFSETVLP